MKEESYRCALESGININGFQIQPCWDLFLYLHFKFSFLVHFVPRKKSSLVNFRIAKVSQLQGHDESDCASENRWVLWGNENMFLCFHILKHCTIWILLPSKCQLFSWHLAFAVSIEFCFDLCKRDKKNPECIYKLIDLHLPLALWHSLKWVGWGWTNSRDFSIMSSWLFGWKKDNLFLFCNFCL